MLKFQKEKIIKDIERYYLQEYNEREFYINL